MDGDFETVEVCCLLRGWNHWMEGFSPRNRHASGDSGRTHSSGPADDRWASCPIVMTSVLASETAPVNQLGHGDDCEGAGRAVRERAELGEWVKWTKRSTKIPPSLEVSPFARNLANVPAAEGLIWQWRLTAAKP